MIDWKIRFKNPIYITQILISIGSAIFLPMLAYNNIDITQLTSWNSVFDLILETLRNPYTLLMVIIGAINSTIDPRSKGIGDNLKLTEVLEYENFTDDSKLE